MAPASATLHPAVTFSPGDLALIERTPEVEIETRAADGTVHRTIIWAVVSDGAVLVRSVHGPGARWYREALAERTAALVVAGERRLIRVRRAVDPASITGCSAGLRAKYAGDFSLGSMLAPDVLHTTLRLEPA